MFSIPYHVVFFIKPKLSAPLALTWILEKRMGGGVDWTHLAQASVQWQALVNTVMNLQVP
jgi:hypothetical protein